MRKAIAALIVVICLLSAACGDASGAPTSTATTTGGDTLATTQGTTSTTAGSSTSSSVPGYSEETIQEWLGICMEGPSWEAFCRCEAEVAAPLADEALFLEHIHSPLWLLPDEALEAQNRLCDPLEPVLRADGVAGVAFGTALEPALAQLTGMFGEAGMVEVPECDATVALWEGLQVTFSSDGSMVGWAYGAFEAGEEADPLGPQIALNTADGTSFFFMGDSPSMWETYSGLASAPEFIGDDPPTVLIVSNTGEESLRAVTTGPSRDDPVVRFEAGTVCAQVP